MTPNHQQTLKQVLTAKRAELAAEIQAIRERLEIDAIGDEMERLMSRTERELAVEQAEQRTALLREVEDALRRIQEGTYGICSKCGGRIRAKRLVVMPWANLCVACQEEEESATSPGGPE
jgi:DnaK suppressor protein